MMEPNYFASQVYECIREACSFFDEYANELAEKDEKLRHRLTFYDQLAVSVTERKLSQIRNEIIGKHDAAFVTTLHQLGVRSKEGSGVDELMLEVLHEKTDSGLGEVEVAQIANDYLERVDKEISSLDDLANQQNQVARLALELEQQRDTTEDSRLNAFLAHNMERLRDRKRFLDSYLQSWTVTP